MKTINNTINAHYDFELHSENQRTVDYSLCLPDGKIKGLIVYISGFGSDSGAYRNNFQKYICDNHSMACLTVDYHCFFSRPGNGAKVLIEKSTMNLLRSITGCINDEDVDTVLFELGKINSNPKVPIKVPATIYPKKNEYQNFGILPALDNLFAINDVFIKYPNIPKTVYAIGSSYGGYIANLMSKLAPCTLNAVFDNSSWANPNMKYIIGEGLGTPEFQPNVAVSPNIVFSANVLSPWSYLAILPNGFDANRQLIRSFPEEHLAIMAEVGKTKTIYRFVHSENDTIADTEQKLFLANTMKNKGFNVQIIIYSKNDIDGQYIKTMDHGMKLSMKTFFSNSIDQIEDLIQDDKCIDFDFKHSLHFACKTKKYTVKYQGNSQPICSVS